MEVTKACLRRVHMLSLARHGTPRQAVRPESVNVRVFLCGFMIAYRPTHVFESMGSLEQNLVEAATPLLKTFERICASIKLSGSFQEVPTELTENFATLLYEYLKRFKAWKVPDEAKLTCRIKHALVALYQGQAYLPPDEPEDSRLKVEFRTQIARLREKLQQIAGEQGLAEFDATRGEPRPFITGPAANLYATMPGRIDNEQLAHELLWNPRFQLDESGGCEAENPVFHKIRESFHKAFWDSLVDDLQLARPCHARVLKVLEEIHSGLREIVGPRSAFTLDVTVDIEFIRRYAETGEYNWESCCGLIRSITHVIRSSQTTARREETEAKWQAVRATMDAAGAEDQPRAFCSALEFLLDRVNAMRIDAANLRLRLIAPVIVDHGIDYERGKFQDKLNDGSLTLERTQQWIRATLARVLQSSQMTLESILENSSHIHTAGILKLVTEPSEPISQETCPETLRMDVHRINAFRQEFRQSVTRAGILATAKHFLAEKQDARAMSVVQEISQVVQEDSRSVDELVSSVIQIVATKDWIRDADVLRRAVNECTQPTDSLHNLL